MEKKKATQDENTLLTPHFPVASLNEDKTRLIENTLIFINPV